MGCNCGKARNKWTVTINGEPTDRNFPTFSSAERYALKVGGEVVKRD
jgi:hypothetical protein